MCVYVAFPSAPAGPGIPCSPLGPCKPSIPGGPCGPGNPSFPSAPSSVSVKDICVLATSSSFKYASTVIFKTWLKSLALTISDGPISISESPFL